VQLQLYGALQDLLMNRIVWFIRNVDFTAGSLDTVVGTYRDGIAAITDALQGTLSPSALAAWSTRARPFIDQHVPEELANRIAAMPDLVAAPDIVLIAQRTGRPVLEIARTHFAIEALFQVGALMQAAREIVVSDYFDRLALDRAIDSIASAHRNLTGEVVASGASGAEAVRLWSERRGTDLTRIRNAVDGIVSSGLTLSKVTVAASLLGDLART
jgi:glutamate dehydrogenase